MQKRGVFSWIGIVFFLVLVRYTGLLLSLEYFFYDYLFSLRASEAKDERIVIVAWTENDIEKFQQGSISDKNLVKVLKTIKNQQPSAIGLDLFRNVPVPSFDLTKEENKQAYRELEEIFSSTTNLVGITKVIHSYIGSPQSIPTPRITSSDLPLDEDNFIRRAFLYPQPELTGLENIYSLSFYTAAKYLFDNGFSIKNARQDNRKMLFVNSENNFQLVLNPLRRFDGGYISGDAGIQFIVNWRKNKSPFPQISVTEVIEGSLAPDFFTGKIVLIGNTSTSTADRHRIPLNRFAKYNKDFTTSGVKVHAHIASSLISAVLDNRPLIKPIPEGIEIIFILFSVGIIVLVADKHYHSPFRLFILSSSVGAFCIVFFTTISYAGFVNGYWIPAVPSIVASILSPTVVCLVFYIEDIKKRKEQIEQKNKKFRQIVKNSCHFMMNGLDSIILNTKSNLSLSKEIDNDDVDEIPEAMYAYEERYGELPLHTIQNQSEVVLYFALKLNEREKNLQEAIRLASLEEDFFQTKAIDLNELLKSVVSQTALDKNYQYSSSIQIEEVYDSTLLNVGIESRSLSTAIENLLDNAFWAVDKKMLENPQHRGAISVKTQKQKNNVLIEISDNGVGIDSSNLKDIFTVYFSTKARNEGHGLGLSLVEETIKCHNGQINVESTVGEGTTFIISLPLKKKE